MKALILNSGLGSRMGVLTSEHPKCMTDLTRNDTILSRQLKTLVRAGVDEIIITTGYYDNVLVSYCDFLNLPIDLRFVKNPIYDKTNYIYSIYCAREFLDDDIILMHGDMVYDETVLDDILSYDGSCMAVSSVLPLPSKDFKAVIDGRRICKVGIEFFDNAVAAQPIYKFKKADILIWIDKITEYCEKGITGCYAENALNEVSGKMNLDIFDVEDRLCQEVDTPEDLNDVISRIQELERRCVYMCFSTDIIHTGHIEIIKKASRLGHLIIGVLSDEAVISYKRFPLVPFEERKALFSNIAGVYKVVEQKTLSYRDNLEKLKPDFVVHGDDWVSGFQKPIREEVCKVLAEYGGKLIEYPYASDTKYTELEKRARRELSLPDVRRGRLKKAIEMKGLITAMEAHNGITGLIVEDTIVHDDGKSYQFDAMWVSSLCDSTAKGKPDIELVDMSSRMRTIDEIMDVTTKPIIFDGDTGGLTEHFVYTVRTLERMGVSAVIIEDKTGLKKNSLFGTEVEQTQDSIEHFSEKISAGKAAQKSTDFMIIARIESLILDKGMEDALIRARAFKNAGADGIMIHSRKKEPDEIFEFVEKFRSEDSHTPIIVVPTSFNSVTEEEFKKRGVNIVIYANQLTRSGFPAMKKTAETILLNHRAKEADDQCIPIKEILTLIPEDY